jgi:hypothetical protein
VPKKKKHARRRADSFAADENLRTLRDRLADCVDGPWPALTAERIQELLKYVPDWRPREDGPGLTGRLSYPETTIGEMYLCLAFATLVTAGVPSDLRIAGREISVSVAACTAPGEIAEVDFYLAALLDAREG